jgi:hypothetical protein
MVVWSAGEDRASKTPRVLPTPSLGHEPLAIRDPRSWGFTHGVRRRPVFAAQSAQMTR